MSSVPFDILKSADVLNTPGINKYVYTPNLVRSMKAKAEKKYGELYAENEQNSRPFHFDYKGFMQATKINHIEDAYIAPIYGYKNHLDYYNKNASGQYVEKITVPLLAINAKDDPFFHSDMSIPDISPNPLRYCNPDYGGHIGFMFHQDHERGSDLPSTSWMPNELSRFVDHVDKHQLMFKMMQTVYIANAERLLKKRFQSMMHVALRRLFIRIRLSLSR